MKQVMLFLIVSLLLIGCDVEESKPSEQIEQYYATVTAMAPNSSVVTATIATVAPTEPSNTSTPVPPTATVEPTATTTATSTVIPSLVVVDEPNVAGWQKVESTECSWTFYQQINFSGNRHWANASLVWCNEEPGFFLIRLNGKDAMRVSEGTLVLTGLGHLVTVKNGQVIHYYDPFIEASCIFLDQWPNDTGWVVKIRDCKPYRLQGSDEIHEQEELIEFLSVVDREYN